MRLSVYALLATSAVAVVAVPQTNLPPPTYSGPLTVQVNSTIDAPIETVWDVLTDFSKYPEWNPFVRSQVIVDEDKKPLEDQTPAVGKYLLIEVHIPPSLDDSVPDTESFEQIIAFDPVARRCAWGPVTFPEWFLRAERWQALSTTEDGKVLYESREVFGGAGAYLVKLFLGTNLMKSFQAMAEAIKTRSEQSG